MKCLDVAIRPQYRSRIANPLEKEMKYTVTRDYEATVERTLGENISGKQVWYSLSHGAVEFGRPDTDFQGLLFLDGGITAAVLPSGLDYRLVMVDGCCSASTGEPFQSAALANMNVSSSVAEFADAFGPKVAYVGWAWTMDAGWAQYYMGQFFTKLKYDKSTGLARTVGQAYQKFLDDHQGETDPKFMRIYGKKDNVVDLRAKGLEQ